MTDARAVICGGAKKRVSMREAEIAASASNQNFLTCMSGMSKYLVVTILSMRLQRVWELIDS